MWLTNHCRHQLIEGLLDCVDVDLYTDQRCLATACMLRSFSSQRFWTSNVLSFYRMSISTIICNELKPSFLTNAHLQTSTRNPHVPKQENSERPQLFIYCCCVSGNIEERSAVEKRLNAAICISVYPVSIVPSLTLPAGVSCLVFIGGKRLGDLGT